MENLYVYNSYPFVEYSYYLRIKAPPCQRIKFIRRLRPCHTLLANDFCLLSTEQVQEADCATLHECDCRCSQERCSSENESALVPELPMTSQYPIMSKSKTVGSNATGERRGRATLGTSGNGAAVFQCQGFGDCRMVFTRSEHLARHIRKHTGERPFQCHCQKTFSRLDNLRQHCQTVHSDKPEQNQELLRKLTALHTNLAASVAATNRHASRASSKCHTQSAYKNVRQKRKSGASPASQEGCDVQQCAPSHTSGMAVNTLLSDGEPLESNYSSMKPLRRSYSPPMTSYTRPAPYSYPRRPPLYAYPTDLPSTRMTMPYPASRVEYPSEMSYPAESVDSSWNYGKFESPNTKLPPLRGASPGSLPQSKPSDGKVVPTHQLSKQLSLSSESRLVPTLPRPTARSRLNVNDIMSPSLAKSSAPVQDAPTHLGSRFQNIPTSLARPSLPRLDSISTDTRPARGIPSCLFKSGKYHQYSSMDEFQHSFYDAPSHGALHRMMDISPAGLGLTSPTLSLSSRRHARYNGIAGQPLRFNASLDGASAGLRLRDPYQKTPTSVDDYRRSTNLRTEFESHPIIPILPSR